MRRTSTGLRLVAATTVLATPLLLAGCGNAIKDAVENQVEDAASSNGVDLDLDDPNHIKVDTTDGGVTTGELPKGYPVSDVPVVDGEIIAGVYTKNPATWNVTVQSGDDPSAAYDAAAGLLTANECSEDVAKVDNGTSVSGSFTCGTYTVQLAATTSTGVVVNYTVSSI